MSLYPGLAPFAIRCCSFRASSTVWLSIIYGLMKFVELTLIFFQKIIIARCFSFLLRGHRSHRLKGFYRLRLWLKSLQSLKSVVLFSEHETLEKNEDFVSSVFSVFKINLSVSASLRSKKYNFQEQIFWSSSLIFLKVPGSEAPIS